MKKYKPLKLSTSEVNKIQPDVLVLVEKAKLAKTKEERETFVKEKHKLKSQKLSQVGKIKRDDFEITEIKEENNKLIVWVKDFKENPIIIVNPPILVPDGTKRIETIDGKEIEIDNFIEDHEKALESIIRDVIK